MQNNQGSRLTFEEIRDKIAEQEIPTIRGFQDVNADARHGFLKALNLLRPLLDGWKDVSKELPEFMEDCKETCDLLLLVQPQPDIIYQTLGRKYPSGWTENGRPHTINVTHWRELPSLPSTYSELEKLIK